MASTGSAGDAGAGWASDSRNEEGEAWDISKWKNFQNISAESICKAETPKILGFDGSVVLGCWGILMTLEVPVFWRTLQSSAKIRYQKKKS